MECFQDEMSRMFHFLVGRRGQKSTFFVFAILDPSAGTTVKILEVMFFVQSFFIYFLKHFERGKRKGRNKQANQKSQSKV